MKTSTPKAPAPRWLLIDAEGQVLGRLAARVALMLRGKNKALFSPHQLCGDHVVVVNAAKLTMTPAKFRRKTYFTHTGYLGHLKAIPLQRMFEERPVELIEQSVHGMLPRNRLRPQALKRLHVFAGADHTFEAQKPVLTPLR
ncbi:MAG TPA: 50S ribosomal protein L13 [Candidatus Peribacter riflensis]|uniref:Large ribosomal subunit protein uL13 n=1 Tax=Candidatus Peribacter riflensis TaxID=1735162 RepID=A0A0S1SHP2_9BACT|nr:MAG: large subunit ribosomal protein L13 [Candidatus Peribacter riflensis]OGJ78146.1 MAG: 50S ribosomal protein L13 [Candidatus Peribacteria bacterium RIFOXYB1_FULL_57_12]OGJ82939.1 MAG: 50S ribosomal protein L13 [Candidatus Peribacteria bacterium RIFOXYC1_FULL_58_8]ALM10537.1 MAG: large subunit ribosomal protein L13 [Candidatus Peribacter riflensis]ALM11640.1 MAG: large subunit ribosomal protein L13 [Candidatus Peribacter riflensis]